MINIVFEEVFPMYVHNQGDTISIPVGSRKLEDTVDSLRTDSGKIPLFREDSNGRQDFEGWYEFRLIVDSENGMPKEVEAWGEQLPEEDACTYHIELSEEDKLEAKRALERELERHQMTLQDLAEIEAREAGRRRRPQRLN